MPTVLLRCYARTRLKKGKGEYVKKVQNLMRSQIAARRHALGITQQQLSVRLGVSRSLVAMWERGYNIPPTVLLPMLADALECRIEDLYPKQNE